MTNVITSYSIHYTKLYEIPFIKPWEDNEFFQKLEKAQKAGIDTFGMDIDAAGLVTLREMGRPVSPKNPSQLRKIIESSSLKFILKGRNNFV